MKRVQNIGIEKWKYKAVRKYKIYNQVRKLKKARYN